MANKEYDLTFKKSSELSAGTGSLAVGDKIPVVDISVNNDVVTRTVTDFMNILNQYAAGTQAAVVGDKFLMIDVSASNAIVLRTLQDIINLINTFADGAQPAVVGDKFIMIDISESNGLVLRTLQDILTLINTIAAGDDPAELTDKFVMIDVSDTNAVVTRTLQDIIDLVSESDPLITARSVVVSVSLAELNAGKTILAGVTSRSVMVTDFNVRCVGAFGDLTAAVLQSITTDVPVATLAQAQMGDGAILFKGAAGVTLGAGFLAVLPAGEGLELVKTGSDATTATNLLISVTYMLSNPV